jgi:hypothetical protein
MAWLSALQAVGGGLLLFVVPGLAVARALFPEWTFRGPGGPRRALETATLAFVLSVALTVLVGAILLGVAPGGFSAAWGDPLLEAALAGIAAIAFVAGVLEGAYSRRPTRSRLSEAGPGEEGAWELTRELDRLRREESRLERRIAATAADAEGSAGLRAELAALRDRRSSLERGREEQYER